MHDGHIHAIRPCRSVRGKVSFTCAHGAGEHSYLISSHLSLCIPGTWYPSYLINQSDMGTLRVSVDSSASPLASCSGFLSFSRLFVPSVFGEWCGACDGQPRRVGHLLHGCHGPKCMYTSSGRLEKISGRVSDLHIQLPKLKFVCGMVRGKIRSLCDRVLRCLISGARARRGGHVA